MVGRLEDFIAGFTAAVELRARAGKLGAFIESVCLGATVIDGALRIGLILKRQTVAGTSEIVPELLYQADDDKPVSERAVYRLARERDVIDQALFEKLELLYQQRNRVVHRYIISELTTQDVLNIALDYEDAMGDVSAAVGELENEQLREGVGMTRSEDLTFELKDLFELSKDKHGGVQLASRLRGKPDAQ